MRAVITANANDQVLEYFLDLVAEAALDIRSKGSTLELHTIYEDVDAEENEERLIDTVNKIREENTITTVLDNLDPKAGVLEEGYGLSPFMRATDEEVETQGGDGQPLPPLDEGEIQLLKLFNERLRNMNDLKNLRMLRRIAQGMETLHQDTTRVGLVLDSFLDLYAYSLHKQYPEDADIIRELLPLSGAFRPRYLRIETVDEDAEIDEAVIDDEA